MATTNRTGNRCNGHFLERLFGDLVLGGEPRLLAEARAVMRPVLSRRVARRYGGFATSQLRAFDDKPTAKRALDVLRTTATGRHLLAHGEIVTDVTRRCAAPASGSGGADDLGSSSLARSGIFEPMVDVARKRITPPHTRCSANDLRSIIRVAFPLGYVDLRSSRWTFRP